MIDDEQSPRSDGAISAQPNVVVHIDRLVLDGVPMSGAQGAQLKASVIRELARLLQRDGVGPDPRGTAVPTLAAPAIQIPEPYRPSDLGRHIARSLHASLNRL